MASTDQESLVLILVSRITRLLDESGASEIEKLAALDASKAIIPVLHHRSSARADVSGEPASEQPGASQFPEASE